MKFLKAFLFVVVACALGIGIAIFRIKDFENSPAFFKNGAWRGTTNLPLGKDPLLTAQITVFALFALPSEEAVYLFAGRDNNNEKLNAANDYTITGNIHQIQSKYWSITAYGKDLYLIPNADSRFGFSSTALVTDSAGNFTINVSAQKKSGNWLPVKEGAPFSLVLRIYKGEKSFMDKLQNTPLPEIKIVKP